MKFAVSKGYIEDDPSSSIKKLATPKSKQHTPWSPSDIAKFRATWPIGTTQRLAFEILHWTGARMSDVVHIGAGNVDRDGWLNFVQLKTHGEVHIPYDRELPEFAEQGDLDQLRNAINCRPHKHIIPVD